MKYIFFSVILTLLLAINVNAVTVYEGTIIQPNSSGTSGYYVLNATLYVDEIIINETHAVFLGLDSENQSCYDVDTSEQLCPISENCTLNYTDTIRNIIFNETSQFPEITIESPLNATYTVSSIWFNVTLDKEGSHCFREFNSTNVSMSNDSTTHFFLQNTSLEDGVYDITFFCNDTGNNWNSTSIIFTINTTSPVAGTVMVNLDCSYDSDFFYVTPNPIGDKTVDWTCRLNTSNNYSCWSHVWVDDKSQKLQTNPEMEIVKDYGYVDYFESQNGIAKISFTDKNLKYGQNYTFVVECIDNSSNWGEYERNVTVELSGTEVYNVAPAMVWVTDNAIWIVGIILIVIIILMTISLIKKKKNNII